MSVTSPWLDENSFRGYVRGGPGPAMRLNGTVAKTLILLTAMLAGAILGGWLPHAAQVARTVAPPIAGTGAAGSTLPLTDDMSQLLFWASGFGSLLVLVGLVGWFLFDWFVEGAQVWMALAFALVQGMCVGAFTLATSARYPGAVLMATAISSGNGNEGWARLA